MRFEVNIVVGLQPDNKAVSMINWIAPRFQPNVFTNNTYINLTATNIFYYTSKQIPEPNKLLLSFEQWKSIIKTDSDSKVITPETEWAKGMSPKIFTNTTLAPMIFHFNNEYKDINGNDCTFVEIQPYKSVVLFKK